MAKPNLEGRKSFQSSGGINWVRFIPWAALVFVAAILLAALMALLFLVGFYLVMLVPLIAALGLAGMVVLAVRKGHCRSRLVGALLGALAGIIVYLGYFYIGMIHDLGWEFAGHPEILPRYIELRMETTTIKDVGAPDHDRHENEPHPERPYFNWAFSAIEFGFIVFIPVAAAIRWAGRPYCEKCQGWMKRETTTFKPEIGPGLVEALRLSSVQSLAALFTSPQKPGAPHTAVAVDYCINFKEGRSPDCPVCLSVKQIKTAAKGMAKDAFDQSKGKVLVRQAIVDPREFPALLHRFASFEKVSGTTAAQALQQLQVEIPSQKPDKVMAEIRPVDPDYAGKVVTAKTGLICAGLALIGLIGVFGPICLGFLGGYLAFPDHPPAGGVSALSKLTGEFLIGLAILIFAANFLMMFTVPDFFSSRYIRRLAEREFKRRPNPIVGPNDPDALFVQIIPRANWAKLKLLDATDMGFLRVDPQRGELLFEGDRECYRVPAAAIVSCDVELFVAGEGTHGATRLYRVVVQINHPSESFWEVPFAQRGNSGKFRSKMREKWARALQQQITALMSPSS